MALDPKSGTASLTSSSFTQIVPADENRSSLILQNLGTDFVEIGGPDSSTGYRLAAGEEKVFFNDFRDESVKGSFYGKSGSGTIDVTWFAGRTERKNFGGWIGGPS